MTVLLLKKRNMTLFLKEEGKKTLITDALLFPHLILMGKCITPCQT